MSSVSVLSHCFLQKADVNVQNVNGDSALMFAAMGGHAELVNRCLSLGLAVNKINKEGVTALMCAATSASPDVMRTVIAVMKEVFSLVVCLVWLSG